MVLPSASGIHPSSAFQQCRADVCRNLELPAQVSEMHLLRLFHFFILIPPDYFFISAHSFSRAIVELSRLPRVYVAATVLHLSPGRILEGRHGTAAAEGRGRRRRRWGGGWRTRGLAGASSGPFVVGMATPWRRGCSPKKESRRLLRR